MSLIYILLYIYRYLYILSFFPLRAPSWSPFCGEEQKVGFLFFAKDYFVAILFFLVLLMNKANTHTRKCNGCDESLFPGYRKGISQERRRVFSQMTSCVVDTWFG